MTTHQMKEQTNSRENLMAASLVIALVVAFYQLFLWATRSSEAHWAEQSKIEAAVSDWMTSHRQPVTLKLVNGQTISGVVMGDQQVCPLNEMAQDALVKFKVGQAYYSSAEVRQVDFQRLDVTAFVQGRSDFTPEAVRYWEQHPTPELVKCDTISILPG